MTTELRRLSIAKQPKRHRPVVGYKVPFHIDEDKFKFRTEPLSPSKAITRRSALSMPAQLLQSPEKSAFDLFMKSKSDTAVLTPKMMDSLTSITHDTQQDTSSTHTSEHASSPQPPRSDPFAVSPISPKSSTTRPKTVSYANSTSQRAPPIALSTPRTHRQSLTR